jgi:hypothetical protein
MCELGAVGVEQPHGCGREAVFSRVRDRKSDAVRSIDAIPWRRLEAGGAAIVVDGMPVAFA